LPPPPEEPPVVFDEPSPVDVQAPPPAPPAPPAAPAVAAGPTSLDASVCSRPTFGYPPAALRARASGTTVVLVTFVDSGQITSTSVQSSSGNRDLDRAATAGVKRYKLCPGSGNGQGLISVNWSLPK
jgi:protein TonB